MKKVLIGIAVLAVATGTAAFLYRDQITMMLAFGRLKPELSFAEATPPVAPDYSQPQSWAALPDRQDAADVLPGGDVQDRQAAAEVDVFFVHPTTFFGTAGWNQSLDDTSTNALTDTFVLRSQASVYNSCCRIYAPRYRQATIYSFMDRAGDGKPALQLAYEDVERAFDYFIEHYNQGRPFILAGHSQGSVHVRTLLREAHHGHEAARAARRRLSDRLRHRSRSAGEGRARRAGVRVGRADRLRGHLERRGSARDQVGRHEQEHLRESADVADGRRRRGSLDEPRRRGVSRHVRRHARRRGRRAAETSSMPSRFSKRASPTRNASTACCWSRRFARNTTLPARWAGTTITSTTTTCST